MPATSRDTVYRRTFAATNYPQGSPERAQLNEDNRTSEYMPSYRYGYQLRATATGARCSGSAPTKAAAVAEVTKLLAEGWEDAR